MSRRRKLLIGAGAALVVLIVGGAVFALTRNGDVSNPGVVFRPEPTETAAPDVPEPSKGKDPLFDFSWATYGYSKDRRHYLPASLSLRPPYERLWKSPGGGVLMEFPPVMAEGRLFMLKNNGALLALSKKTGRLKWRRRLGTLAASSPAYGNGRVFATLLNRGRGKPGALVALRARDGKPLWSRALPSRTESSPVFDSDRVYFGSENGTVYSVEAGNGNVRWTFKASGAVKCGLALADGRLYFGDYSGKVYAIRQPDGRKVWETGTHGAGFGFSSGTFYSTPAVAFGRVYIGNTDGKMYSFAADSGKLAWTKGTGAYVYSSPAVAQVPRGKPTVYFGSYSGTFYALDARSGKVRWSYDDHGAISGGPTVVGDIVYFANIRSKHTIGLGARTGRRVFAYGTGAYNPVISDGRTIFLTGYSSLEALRPRR